MYYPAEYQKIPYEREKVDITAPRKKVPATQNESAATNQCKICGLINFNAWSLTIHMRRHNNDRPAKCSYCPAAFVNNTELKSHITTHTKEKRYKCRFCAKWFTNNSSKSVHEDTHRILEHKCKYCDEKFFSQSERRVHHKTHCRGVLTCRFCVKKFANSEFLRLHEQNHHSKILNCKRCKLKFQSEEEVQAHKRIHKSVRGTSMSKRSNEVNYFQDSDVKLSAYFFTCGICYEKFSFRLDLAKHIESNHPSIEKESIYKFKCPTCNKSFDTKTKLRGHMIGHGPRKHKCPHCDYSSTRGKDLARHVQAKHSLGQNFKCSQCGALFTHYATFVFHKLKHGEKKFKCDMCDKAYYVKARLSNHKRVSHYTGNPVCDQCGKVFRNILTLRAHQRNFHNRPLSLCLCNNCGKSLYTNEVALHQNECSKETVKEIVPKIDGPLCSACNITFSMQRDLLEHVKELHPSGIYPCKYCPKEYLSAEVIRKHIERKHMPNKPLLRKHKHIFTLEEKRTLKKDRNSFPCNDLYECFACGTSFFNEDDMIVHLDDSTCLRPKSMNEQKVQLGGEQNFSITKVYQRHGCSQVLGDFEVQIIPKSLNLEPLTVKTLCSSDFNPVRKLNKNKSSVKQHKHLKPWAPSDENATRVPRFAKDGHSKQTTDNEVQVHNVMLDGEFYHSPPVVEPQQPTQAPQPPIQENSQQGVVSSKDLLKLLQNKTVNVDGTSFVPFNELYEHLRLISGIETGGTT